MITVSAPGKAILHGEHSVVYGKAAIAVTVNLRTKVTLTEVKDTEKVALHLDDVGLQFHNEWSIADVVKVTKEAQDDNDIISVTEDYLDKIRALLAITGVESDKPSYHSALTYLYLYSTITRKYKPTTKLNVCANVTSEIPVGAGLGSSAAYSVCLSAALLQLCGQLENREHPLTESNLTLINKWAFQAERVLHGKPSGIDNSICTYGGALLFQNGTVQKVLRNVPQLKILLVNTRVSRNTKDLVAKVKTKYDNYPTVITSILKAMEEIAVQQWTFLEKLSNSSETVCGRSESFHELVTMNQHLLNCLGAGHPKLDMICNVAESFGLAAKLTGAGAGGCAIVFLQNSNEMVVGEIKEKFILEGLQVWEVGLACTGISLH